MLRFLVVLFRAWGIELSLEECPDGAPLLSARRLEAANPDDSSPPAASKPRVSTWGAGDPSPVPSVDDLCTTPSREGFADDPATAPGSSDATVAPSSSSHR